MCIENKDMLKREYNQKVEVSEENLFYLLKALTKTENFIVKLKDGGKISLEDYLNSIKVLVPLNQELLQKLMDISNIKIKDIRITIENLINEIHKDLKEDGYF